MVLSPFKRFLEQATKWETEATAVIDANGDAEMTIVDMKDIRNQYRRWHRRQSLPSLSFASHVVDLKLRSRSVMTSKHVLKKWLVNTLWNKSLGHGLIILMKM